MTKVIKCKCENEFQDQRYGKGMRLHNKTTKNGKHGPVYRCTVCSLEKEE